MSEIALSAERLAEIDELTRVKRWRSTNSPTAEALANVVPELVSEIRLTRPVVSAAELIRDMLLAVDSRLTREERAKFDQLSEAVDAMRTARRGAQNRGG